MHGAWTRQIGRSVSDLADLRSESSRDPYRLVGSLHDTFDPLSLERQKCQSAVKVGGKTLRGAVETGLDGVADSALTALGAPELAPMADKLIDKGVKQLEKKGTSYLDQQNDKSGKGYGGVRYMSASGGMRLAGSGTQVGAGMRLAGNGMSWHNVARGIRHKRERAFGPVSGQGMRLAGSDKH